MLKREVYVPLVDAKIASVSMHPELQEYSCRKSHMYNKDIDKYTYFANYFMLTHNNYLTHFSRSLFSSI